MCTACDFYVPRSLSASVRPGHEEEDLDRVINPGYSPTNDHSITSCSSLLCCLTGVGACYVCCRQVLYSDNSPVISLSF